MRTNNLAFIDTETTGLNFDKHEIIELSGIIVSQVGVLEGNPQFEIIDEFNMKIKPERIEDADPIALKINHYNEEEWEDAVSLQDAISVFIEKTQKTILVGHNIAFDWAFLEKSLHRTGLQSRFQHYHMLDTISIAYAKLHGNDGIDRFSLHALCEYFKIENKKEHSALADVHATFELYKKLMVL